MTNKSLKNKTQEKRIVDQTFLFTFVKEVFSFSKISIARFSSHYSLFCNTNISIYICIIQSVSKKPKILLMDFFLYIHYSHILKKLQSFLSYVERKKKILNKVFSRFLEPCNFFSFDDANIHTEKKIKSKNILELLKHPFFRPN